MNSILRTLNKLQTSACRSSLVRRVGYGMPLSPLRGAVWNVLNKNAHTILDVGCERGKTGTMLFARGKGCLDVTGLDIHVPYLRNSKASGSYVDLVHADARTIPFKNEAFDAVICVDVLEHLDKNDSTHLVNELERVARTQVIMTVPTNVTRYEEAWADTQLQMHVSKWRARELVNLGYEVRGMVGPDFVPGDIAYWMSFIVPLSWFTPEKASHILCWKNLENSKGINK